MRRTLLHILWVPILLLVAFSCTHNPRITSGSESDYLLKLRAEYFASNPSGEHNEFIKRGEVVKGMDLMEVLAAWGHPKVRTKENLYIERWIYRELDEVSKDWIEYTFTFRQGLLDEWELSRHFAAGGIVDVPEGRDMPSLSKDDYSSEGGAGAPKKH